MSYSRCWMPRTVLLQVPQSSSAEPCVKGVLWCERRVGWLDRVQGAFLHRGYLSVSCFHFVAF